MKVSLVSTAMRRVDILQGDQHRAGLGLYQGRRQPDVSPSFAGFGFIGVEIGAGRNHDLDVHPVSANLLHKIFLWQNADRYYRDTVQYAGRCRKYDKGNIDYSCSIVISVSSSYPYPVKQ